jgi:enamine deaminase RidA (YjgF/YER057c/UK114 family)
MMRLALSISRHAFIALLVLGSSLLFAEPQPAATPNLPPPAKQRFNLGPWENEIGYAQAVRVGNTLYVSGSVGGGEMPAAIRQAFDTIARTLSAHHLGFEHVVKENVFTTDIEALKAHKEVRNAYYKADYPAATWVQVARLYDTQHVIEVEVIAVFP